MRRKLPHRRAFGNWRKRYPSRCAALAALREMLSTKRRAS